MKKFRTIIPEKLDIIAKNALSKAGIKVSDKLIFERKQLLNVIEDYDAAIIRNETQVDKEFLDRAHNIKIIVRAGSGYDNVDLKLCEKKKVTVANVPEGNIMSAAELTIGMMLAVCRNIVWSNNHTRLGNWDRPMFKGMELHGKTLGIIGLGKVGKLVARRALALGMKIIAYDPYIPNYPFTLLGVERMENLNDLLKKSNIITIHTPKTSETYDMISDKEIEMMKQGVYLLNIARGGLLNEKALVRGLKNNKIAGVAIDNWDEEPQTKNDLYKFKNVVVTPHLGATTLEAQKRVAYEAANRVINFWKNKPIRDIVI